MRKTFECRRSKKNSPRHRCDDVMWDTQLEKQRDISETRIGRWDVDECGNVERMTNFSPQTQGGHRTSPSFNCNILCWPWSSFSLFGSMSTRKWKTNSPKRIRHRRLWVYAEGRIEEVNSDSHPSFFNLLNNRGWHEREFVSSLSLSCRRLRRKTLRREFRRRRLSYGWLKGHWNCFGAARWVAQKECERKRLRGSCAKLLKELLPLPFPPLIDIVSPYHSFSALGCCCCSTARCHPFSIRFGINSRK